MVSGPAEFYSSRVPKRQRKQTIMDELLQDHQFKRSAIELCNVPVMVLHPSLYTHIHITGITLAVQTECSYNINIVVDAL